MKQAIAIQTLGLAALAAGVYGLLGVWWFLLAAGAEAVLAGWILEQGARGKTPPT